MASEIITKTSEITEKMLAINHSVGSGQSLLIGVKNTDGTMKVLLEIKAAPDYTVTLQGTITDQKNF